MISGQVNPMQVVTMAPQVTPTAHQIFRATIGGQEYVILKFDDQTGCKTVCYGLTQAKELAEAIRATAVGLQLVTPTQQIER